MSAPLGHDLSRLIQWCARDEWRTRVDDVMAEHFTPSMKAFGLEFEEIGDALGGTWAQALWACAFEDFLTRRFGLDVENPAEAYLRHRGWKERSLTRSYIAALQTSVMSLYEVSDIAPGTSFRARDLIRGGEPVLVNEHSATQTLKPWDRIAGRIVQQGSKMILSGGLLAFTLEGSQSLFAQLGERYAHVIKRGRRSGPSLAALEGWVGTDEELQRAAPLFTTTWLFDVLPPALGITRPTLLNSDGDEVVFHTVTFPLMPGVAPGEIARRLSTVPSLREETPTFWNWIGSASPQPAKSDDTRAIIWNITLEDGAVVLGAIELKEQTISLVVTSAARA